ncbi:MAG: DUF6884 domain-containing protein [Nanoarchaeota archaeon]
MKRVALIPCSKNKIKTGGEVKAVDLYSASLLFRKILHFVLKQKYDKIFIISAKYGLLRLNQKIQYYDSSLKNISKIERVKWGDIISSKLNKILDKSDYIDFYIPKIYIKYISKNLQINHKNILQGMRIGERLHFLST